MQNKVDVAVMIGSGVPETLRALGQKPAGSCCSMANNAARRSPAAVKLRSAGLPGRR